MTFRLPNLRRLCTLVLSVSMLSLAACGGGGGSGSSGPTSSLPTLARIDVSPASLVLRPGEVARLSARVTDSSGALVSDAQVQWQSLDGVVSVAADGTVTAGNSVASAVITASVGTLSSPPVTALVAKPVDGAQMVADAQVVTDPVLVDTTQVPGPGAQLRMTLAGNNAPAVGTLLLSSGSKRIGGKVVSTTANGANTDVVFEVQPLAEMFKQLKFSQTFAPRDLTDKFDVQPTKTTERLDGGREYEFLLDTPDTPVPNAVGGRAHALGTTKPLGIPLTERKWKVGPFKCKSKTEAIPVIGFVQMAPHIIDNMGPVSAVITVDDGNFFVETQTQGSIKLVLDGEMHVGGQLKGSIGCDARLLTREIPVPPVIAIAFVPTVMAGLRASVSGALQGGDVVVGVKSEVEQPLRVGLRIEANGTVTDLSDFDTSKLTTKFAWKVKSASAAADTFRFVGDVKAGAYAQAGFTNVPLLLAGAVPALEVDPYKSLIDVFAGLHPNITLASTNQQLQDPTIKAGYSVNALVQASPGSDVVDAFTWLSKFVKYTDFPIPSKKYEPALFSQPVGAARASLRRFTAGEQVMFRVMLDPTTVEPTFLGQPTVGYNVKQVEIWRKTSPTTSERIGTASGAPGQSDFTVKWTADASGSTADSLKSADPATFYAVVADNVFDNFQFRVAPALGWLGAIQFGRGYDQEGRKVAVDPQGNVIIATWSVDPLVKEGRGSVGGYDEIQIVKLDPYGQVVWLQNIDGPGDEIPTGLQVDSSGAIYVVGNAFASPLTDAATGASGFSAWAARLDSAGNVTWLTQWQEQGSAYSTASDVALGPNHELYVAGTTATAPLGVVGGTVFSFDCGDVESSMQQPQYDCGNPILIRLNAATGARVWAKTDVRAGMQVGRGMSVDSGGNVYTACQTFVDTQTQSAGDSIDNAANDAFYHRYQEPVPNSNNTISHSGACFMKWASDGSVLWRSNLKLERTTTPTGGHVYSDEWPVGIVATPGGQVWTMIRSAGTFPGSSNAGQLDSALFSIDPLDGTPTLGTLYGSAGVDSLSLTGPIVGGDMLVVGTTDGSLFGPNAGGKDVVVARLASDGSQRWAQQFGGPGNDLGYGAGAGLDGSIFVTGSTDGLMPDTLSGPAPLTPRNVAAGGKDNFIAKLSPLNGTIQAVPRAKATQTTQTTQTIQAARAVGTTSQEIQR
jgi:hypothetical protein